jgi:hypothetical protein
VSLRRVGRVRWQSEEGELLFGGEPVMRKKRTDPAGEESQYCVVCAATMPIERIEAADHLVDDPDEWICVQCGFALLIDPPLQELHRTA